MVEPELPDMRVHVTIPVIPLLDGRTVVGGEVYDAGSGRFHAVADQMGIGSSGRLESVLADGRVLATGGNRYGLASSSGAAQIFDRSTGTWLPTGPMVVWRLGHTATILTDGRALIAGGVGFSGQVPGDPGYSTRYTSLASAESYVPYPIPDLPSPESSAPQ
jgi:hypothetical protein